MRKPIAVVKKRGAGYLKEEGERRNFEKVKGGAGTGKGLMKKKRRSGKDPPFIVNPSGGYRQVLEFEKYSYFIN